MSKQFYQKPKQDEPSNHSYNRDQNKLFLDDHQANPNQPLFPIISASSHPVLSLVHIGLKIGTVALYLLMPLISEEFFWKQIVIVLAAIDFWIVKNVCGRLMVGLRWWVDFDEEGEQKWKFECKVNQKDISAADDKIFWWTLAFFALVWLILSVINVLRIDITNIMICLFCGAMIFFNLYSYYKCSKVQSQNIKKFAAQYGTQAIGQFMSGSIIANYI